MTRLLFVCLGNICRSPAAEAVMRQLVHQAGRETEFEIDSAGTASYHVGRPSDHRMRAAADRRGYQMTKLARNVSPADLKRFDLIVAMDRSNFRDLQKLAPGVHPHICLMSDFLDDKWPVDVPDPYTGGPEGFEFVLDMVEAACPKILERY